jgi:hypothetical protein
VGVEGIEDGKDEDDYEAWRLLQLQHQLGIFRNNLTAHSKNGGCDSDLELRSCEAQVTPYKAANPTNELDSSENLIRKSFIFSG